MKYVYGTILGLLGGAFVALALWYAATDHNPPKPGAWQPPTYRLH